MVGLSSVNHAKSNFYKEIPFNAILDIISNLLWWVYTSEAGHVNELVKRSLRKSSNPTIVWASKASFTSELDFRSLRKSSKQSKSLSLANHREQIKLAEHKPYQGK